MAALIEKSPKDLPLFASNVLTIFDLVLGSNDITMVEASLPTFETFCEHHDASSLFADQAYLRQYEDVVRAYAKCASTRQSPGKGDQSKSVALRWRNAGLEAIKSIAESEALSSVAGRQLDVIVPKILENLWTDDEDFLQAIIQRAEDEENEKADGSTLLRRRTSVSTVKTDATGGDTNPVAITGSSGDIDKLAEEDTAVAALRCLKQIFVIPTRAQIHGGTVALLKFISERIQEKEAVVKTEGGRDGGWAIIIFDLVARWAPVQDRYVIMVSVMDKVIRGQPNNDNVPEQIMLMAIIGSLLRSEVNLIGLSVMDILSGLLQHMRRVLKHSGSRSNGSTSTNELSPTATNTSGQMAAPHKELLGRIEQCIADLATHVYYADQISDMVSAILSRLRPHPSIASATATPPTEKADGAQGPNESITNVSEDQHHLDSFFAMDLAKLSALRAVKSVFLVANPNTKVSGNVSLSRNKVPIHVWEGTQWLLRDPDGMVRKAYVDALVTWLDRETVKADRRANVKASHREAQAAASSRRAVSSASARKPGKGNHSQFIQLLHLAVYDNALQFIDYESDLVLLHLLLYKLVNKLGVNAVRYGLSMIFRLQEDIQDVETPLAKVRLGCLCHGYFWAVTETFDFESTPTGAAVHEEIVRRRSKNFWVEGIHIPPPTMDLVGVPGSAAKQTNMPVEVESEALLPFDDRTAMVDYVSANYPEAMKSPPNSPPTSPGRGLNHPILGSTLSSPPLAPENDGLPSNFKEDMLLEWTREAAVTALRESTRSISISGSKTGTTATQGQRLAINGLTANGQSPIRPGTGHASQHNLRPGSHAGGQHGHMASLRKSSVHSRGSGRSGSPRGNVASVDQLKSVLSGSGDAARPGTFRTVAAESTDSDSVASYDFTPSEMSFNPPATGTTSAENGGTAESAPITRSRSKSRERSASGESAGGQSSHPSDHPNDANAEDVPPVPPLPQGVVGRPPTSQTTQSRPSTRDHTTPPQYYGTGKRGLRSRGGMDGIFGGGSGGFSPDSPGSAGMDLQSLLKGIDSKSREGTLGNLTKPPY